MGGRIEVEAASFCTADDADDADALRVEVATHTASTKITRSMGRSEAVVTRNMGAVGDLFTDLPELLDKTSF